MNKPKEPYPERLLPATKYGIMPESSLATQSGLILIRHVESDKAKFIGNTNILNPDCIDIQSDHLRDLSTNLLGIFETTDVCFGIHKDFHSLYTCLWDGKTKCEPPRDSQYFYDSERGRYFIEVDRLTNRIIKYTVCDQGTEEYHFKILHTPTRCNYWHISIRAYDSNDTEISETGFSRNKKKRIWRMLKEYLVTNAIVWEIPQKHTVLDSGLYSNE